MPLNLDKGPIVVLGAVLVQVLAGTVYVWGTISVYICSYLQNNGAPDTTYESTFLVIPLSYLFTAVSGPIATGPLHFVSPRIITFIGCILITLSIYLCQFVRSSALVLLLYGVVAGIGEGFVFLIPVKCSLYYYPDWKGLITGLNYAGLSIGLFIFSELFFFLVNPHNKSPDVVRMNGDIEDKYFSNEIAQNFPRALSIMCLIMLVLSIFASLLIRKPGTHWQQIRLSDISDET